jgi:hypothetical protein
MPNEIDSIDDLFDRSDWPPAKSRAITADNITDQLCAELVQTIDDGDFSLTDWDIEFIGGNLGRTTFSPKQRAVIYKLAFKLKLL